ncbi:MAG: response regulator [Pirellulales bacterium]
MIHGNNRRVLIVDDNPAIHDDFRKILALGAYDDDSLSVKEELLFGESTESHVRQRFEVETALQGQEGVEMVLTARREGQPYAVAFVDIRMPPGIDGIETIERVTAIDPEIQFVICSAYSDYSAYEILLRLGVSDRLLLLRKPCDAAEILLMTCAMCEKWNLAHNVRAT